LLLGPSWGENGFPIVFHADDDPAFGHAIVPCFVEPADVGFAVVSPFARPYRLSDSFSSAPLRINRQTMIQCNEPTKAEIRSSNVILISARPKSMWNNRKRNPPTTAPTIRTTMLVQSPKPRLLKVMRRPASVPASAPTINQTTISPTVMIQSFLLEERCSSPEAMRKAFPLQRAKARNCSHC